MTTRKERTDALVATALEACGYRALPNRGSNYGSLTGYNGQAWNGSFVTVIAREVGLALPSMTDTTAGLAYFTRKNRLYQKPRLGDIMFTALPVNGQFSGPRIGIVTDVTGWKKEHRVRAVAGEVASGLPRASTTANGVFERDYFEHDILGFGRPDFSDSQYREPETSNTTVRVSHFSPGSKATGRIETLQLALFKTVGLRDAARGKLDKQTASAYSQWQRENGRVGTDANGVPDTETLTTLGRVTGLFTVKE